MIRLPSSILRLAPSAAAAAMILFGASGALAEVQIQIQDRDVSRVISISGSCGRCELSGRRLTGANFVGANFTQAMLVGSDLRGATIVGSNFSESDLSRADLRGAELVGSLFTRAILARARMDGVEAHGASFALADLSHANLRGADLSRARGLTQSQINDACSDSSTRLPDGLTARSCGGGRGGAPRPVAPPRPYLSIVLADLD